MRLPAAILAALAALAVAGATASPARAQSGASDKDLSPEVRGYLDRGLAHFKAKEYQAAISEFQAGYKLEPASVFLFAWAQSERLSGDCQSAVVLYRKFLGTKPPQAQAEAAVDALTRCEDTLATQPSGDLPAADEPADTPPPANDTVDADPAPSPAPVPTVAADREPVRDDGGRTPWYKDPLGDALLVGGVVGLGLGATFWILSSRDMDAAAEAATDGQAGTLLDRAEGRRTIAIAGVAVGSALLVGAVVRYVTRDPGGRRAGTAWIDTDGGGGGVAWVGTW